VSVKGDVTESIRIKAKGKVRISGAVYGAVVQADDDVVIGRGIVRSKVAAGYRAAAFGEFLTALHPLETDLGRLLATLAEIKKHPSFVSVSRQGDGPIIKVLVERNFPALPQYAETLKELVTGPYQEVADEEFASFVNTLHQSLVGRGPLMIERMERLADLQVDADRFIKRFTQEVERKANVITRYVQNAEVRASGQIILSGGGSFNSHLWSGSGVEMESGVFRGHSITVHEGDVYLKEVGSKAAVSVRIELVKGGQFRAQHVHPNVEVVIKGQSYTFDSPARFVAVTLTEDGIKVNWDAR